MSSTFAVERAGLRAGHQVDHRAVDVARAAAAQPGQGAADGAHQQDGGDPVDQGSDHRAPGRREVAGRPLQDERQGRPSPTRRAPSPTVLTATASADAINGSFKVTVSQLATSTRVASGGPMGTSIDPNATLANAGFRYSVNAGQLPDQRPVDHRRRHHHPQLADRRDQRLRRRRHRQPGRRRRRPRRTTGSRSSRAPGPVDPARLARATLQRAAAAEPRRTPPSPADTAASTNSGMAASAGALNTSITINGVTTDISQGERRLHRRPERRVHRPGDQRQHQQHRHGGGPAATARSR